MPREVLGDVIYPLYGMAESYSCGMTLRPESIVLDGTPQQQKQITSAGKPHVLMRLKVADADGNEFPFKGSYREVVPPERIVSTETFDVEPWSSHETVVTVTLTEHDGKTLLTSRALYQSKEARDAHIQSGMEYGAGESYDRLEEYLRAMA